MSALSVIDRLAAQTKLREIEDLLAALDRHPIDTAAWQLGRQDLEIAQTLLELLLAKDDTYTPG